jgi:predicted nuclease of predicted toxin-antitoxin system
MNILADESCAGPVVRALREAGHDVLAIVELARGAADEQVLQCALSEKRVLITEVRDFGELVYARGRSSAGVILVRFDSRARQAKPATVVEAVAKLGSRLHNAFTVIGGRAGAHKQPTLTAVAGALEHAEVCAPGAHGVPVLMSKDP